MVVDAQLVRHTGGHGFTVAGEHDGAHPLAAQGFHRPGGVLFQFIRNEDGAAERAFPGYIDHRAHAVIGHKADGPGLHQLGVARQHQGAVHLGGHALPGDLLGVFRPTGGSRAGFPQALADGMAGIAFRKGG